MKPLLPPGPASLVIAAILILPMPVLADPADPLGGAGGGPVTGSIDVRVVEEGSGVPIPGAFVMVGPRAGEPFAPNWGFASETGSIRFEDPSLQGPTTVTAGSPGRAYFTIVSVDANDLVLPLRPVSVEQEPFQVGDFVSGVDVNNGSFHAGDGNVDMALVLPALTIESVLSSNLAGLMGPPEILEVLGEQFEVPANIFIPQQWELFVEIRKDHYYQYLPAGEYTLTAMSGRVPLDAVMNMGGIVDLISLMSWREIDILDVSVVGNTLDADLWVDPDLAPTVTLNLANIPEGTEAWCYSLGDIDGLSGLGRLVPLGVNILACPDGTGPCSGPVGLTTTAAAGEFGGMGYFPAVIVDDTASEDYLILLDRAPHPQTYVEEMSTYFRRLDLSYRLGTFSWNDAANPSSGSPPVDLHLARFVDSSSGDLYWEFLIPGGSLDLGTPRLPAGAPAGPIWGSIYQWQHASFGLGHDLPAFDYGAFAFRDILGHLSHAALDRMDFVYLGDPASIADSEPPAPEPAFARPNPFDREVWFTVDRSPGPTAISVHTADGRLVRTLPDGRGQGGGPVEIVWDGRDAEGRHVPSGVYLLRVNGTDGVRTWRLVRRQ